VPQIQRRNGSAETRDGSFRKSVVPAGVAAGSIAGGAAEVKPIAHDGAFV
jgi:hypothetical protein